MLKVGSIVRAPWHNDGDDANLTGTVTSIRKGKVTVTWNGDGTVTPAGEESIWPVAQANALLEVVSL